MSDDEKLELLASDGMLVKRPLAISGNHLTSEFKYSKSMSGLKLKIM